MLSTTQNHSHYLIKKLQTGMASSNCTAQHESNSSQVFVVANEIRLELPMRHKAENKEVHLYTVTIMYAVRVSTGHAACLTVNSATILDCRFPATRGGIPLLSIKLCAIIHVRRCFPGIFSQSHFKHLPQLPSNGAQVKALASCIKH